MGIAIVEQMGTDKIVGKCVYVVNNIPKEILYSVFFCIECSFKHVILVSLVPGYSGTLHKA